MANAFNNSGITIGCWNLNGLNEEKCNDKVLLDFIDKHDCTIIVESWLNV
jgi:hypothetical protein